MPKRSTSRAYMEAVMASQKERRAMRAASIDRLKRRIEMGYVNGKVHANGAIEHKVGRKGFIPYTTRQLVNEIRAAMDRNEGHDGRRVCYINGRYRLQVRGKDLRRVLKAMPNVRQVGRSLVEDPR